MPPKKARKQKPYEKLIEFYDTYKKNCEDYGVEELESVKAIYDEAIMKKSKKPPVMLQFADEEVNADQLRPLIESYQHTDTKIKILAFYNTNTGDAGLHQLGHALEPPLELLGLAYHNNNVGPSGCRGLARYLVKSKFLSILELDFNTGIGDDGAAGLTNYGHCESLNRLSLNFCNIGDRGAEFIARWIAKPDCQIKELLLKGNRIGPLGAKALGAYIHDNKSLNRVDLSDNIFGYDKECLESLYDGIKACPTLNAISLMNNYECPEGIADKFLQLVTDKPLGEFALTVKMDCNTFQNTKAISITNAKKIAKEAKKKKKEVAGEPGKDGEAKEGDAKSEENEEQAKDSKPETPST